MNTETASADMSWPIRPWILSGLGAVIGLAIQQLVDLPKSGWEWGLRLVLCAVVLLGVGGIAFGLSWQRGRHMAALFAALVCGFVSGGVFLWNGVPEGRGFEPSWPLACGLVASGFLLVLFQAAQERHGRAPAHWSLADLKAWKRQALHYPDVHSAIWTDAILLGASAVFMLAVILIAHLLANMFHLVKIDLFHDLLRKNWTNAILFGGALGGGLGLLRERGKIISALQHVVMLVFRVLAPVLAVGLVSFLAVLPFTGLAPLWATGDTTPMMLSAALVALFLVNAVIGERGEEAALSRPLRWGAIALGLAMLPLVVIAAWSTGLRIGQHGFSPDRLWALTFIILGTVTAVAYAAAILRRGDWIGQLYRSNLHLAFLLGGVALLLSTSIISFERIATADQIARLESGRIKAADFDYRGLWFDFGPPGKAAIRRLAAQTGDPQIRKWAAETEKLTFRFDSVQSIEERKPDPLEPRLTIAPKPVPLAASLRARLTSDDLCGAERSCLLRFLDDRKSAIIVILPIKDCKTCGAKIMLLRQAASGAWNATALAYPAREDEKSRKATDALIEDVRDGAFEFRTVTRRQFFIGGEPVGDAIPPDDTTKP